MKKLSDPITKRRFDNFVTTEKESKRTSNKMLQNTTDISIFQKIFILAHQGGVDTKMLAS